jgi:hypothetical protein
MVIFARHCSASFILLFIYSLHEIVNSNIVNLSQPIINASIYSNAGVMCDANELETIRCGRRKGMSSTGVYLCGNDSSYSGKGIDHFSSLSL